MNMLLRPMNRIALIALALFFAASANGADVRFGIDVLQDDNFQQLAGKRVALVANPAAVDAKLRATSDVLAGAKNVQLISMFGPEHGIYGNEYAGDKVE